MKTTVPKTNIVLSSSEEDEDLANKVKTYVSFHYQIIAGENLGLLHSSAFLCCDFHMKSNTCILIRKKAFLLMDDS